MRIDKGADLVPFAVGEVDGEGTGDVSGSTGLGFIMCGIVRTKHTSAQDTFRCIHLYSS